MGNGRAGLKAAEVEGDGEERSVTKVDNVPGTDASWSVKGDSRVFQNDFLGVRGQVQNGDRKLVYALRREDSH